MSVEQQQFEALKSLADGASIDYTLTQATAGSKFVELCAQMIESFGLQFVTSGGSIEYSKADGLYQLAKAMGANPDTTSGKTILVSAKAIYDASGATEPITGTAYSWRVYQYLHHALGLLPYIDEAWDWLTGGLVPDTNEFNDRLDVSRPRPLAVESNCLTLTDQRYVTCRNTENSLIDSDYTIISDFYATGTGVYVIQRSAVDNSPGEGILIQAAGNIYVRHSDGAATNDFIHVGPPLAVGWHSVAATYDNTAKISKLYFDGVLVATSNPRPYGFISTSAMEINRLNRTNLSDFYTNQHVCCVEIYDTVEDPLDRDNITTTPYLKYTMAEGEELAVTDVSGNSRHGDVHGTSADLPWSNTQDIFHNNLEEGFELFEKVDNAISLSYQDDNSAILTGGLVVPYINEDDEWYALTTGGLYYSDDEWDTQAPLDLIEPLSGQVHRMSFQTSKGTVFWSPWGYGKLRRSLDGTTYTDNLEFADNGDSQGIWGFDEAPNGDLYAGVYTQGEFNASVYKSSDNGDSWSLVYYDATENHIHNVKVDPYTEAVYVVTGDTQRSVLRSDDGGDSWVNLTIAAGALNKMLTMEFTPTIRYFGDDATGHIYTTTDDVAFIDAFAPVADLTNFDSWQYDGYVWFSQVSHGAGNNPQIVRTSNGVDWQIIRSGYTSENWSGLQRASNPSPDGYVYGFWDNLLRIDVREDKSQRYPSTYGVNLITNAQLAGAGPVPDNWIIEKGAAITTEVLTLTQDEVGSGLGALNVAINNPAGTSEGGYLLTYDLLDALVADGDSIYVSLLLKSANKESRVRAYVDVFDISDVFLQRYDIDFPVVRSEYGRYGSLLTINSANAHHAKLSIGSDKINPTSIVDLSIAAPMLEKSSTLSLFAPKGGL